MADEPEVQPDLEKAHKLLQVAQDSIGFPPLKGLHDHAMEELHGLAKASAKHVKKLQDDRAKAQADATAKAAAEAAKAQEQAATPVAKPAVGPPYTSVDEPLKRRDLQNE